MWLLDLIGKAGWGGSIWHATHGSTDSWPEDPLARTNEQPAGNRAIPSRSQVGAQLQHENLVRIYDEGEANGKCYLVMEYIEGKNIGDHHRRERPDTAGHRGSTGQQVASDWSTPSSKGLIHRDVNPYNILVTRDGVAKLTDLGLAIDLDRTGEGHRDGATVGTFDYVAPEQARHSHSADTRSDIYSLGCTTVSYVLRPGPIPHPQPAREASGAPVDRPDATSGWCPGLPEGLSEIVRRMMKKSPKDRYATPIEVASALSPYRGDSTRFGDREGKPPIRVPLVVGTARPSIDAAGPHESGGVAASVEAVPATAGPNASSEVAAKRETRPFAATPAVPLLTPDDDLDWAADEIRLIPDPDPEPSSCGGRPQPGTRSSADDWLSTAFAVSVLRWLTPARRWGLVALATMVAVFILILAMAR